MQISFLRWSRRIHKWIGIYVAVLTFVWLLEIFLLPVMYRENIATPALPGVSPVAFDTSYRGISLQRFIQQLQTEGYDPYAASAQIRLEPAKGLYTFTPAGSFTHLEFDAFSGRFQGSSFDSSALFREKAALGWIHPVVKKIVKAPFEAAFVLLAVTGVYILWPGKRKQRRKDSQSLLDLAPGREFYFQGTRNVADMGRMAALGLMPGVRARVLRAPVFGPLVLSARHTRIAVARDVAATFIIDTEVA